MKNFLDDLAQHDISAEKIDSVAKALQQRAQNQGFAHPLSVYQSLAVDLALGAVETQKEVAANMGDTHTAAQWLDIIVAS